MRLELVTAALANSRFSDVRWVAETGSTNADLLELARHGGAEGVVLVADHQSAGRGRGGRSWIAPAGTSLLLSVLLRPGADTAASVTMAVAVAAAEAVDEVAGFLPRLKWPNDLVWPGDGVGADRKLAGILAEADWPARSPASAGWSEPPAYERVAVVVGLGLNLRRIRPMPHELDGLAVAVDELCGREVDRGVLLVAFLRRLDAWYGSEEVSGRWRALSATLGRIVRVDLGTEDVVGIATDVDRHGHLVIDTLEGTRRTIAMGDVVHVRSG